MRGLGYALSVFGVALGVGLMAQHPAPPPAVQGRLDARPVFAINTFNGNPGDELGRHWRWATDEPSDEIAWLESQMQIAFDAGLRRVCLILPAGNPRTTDDDGTRTPMAANQFRALPEYKGMALRELTQRFKRRDPSWTVGVYIGFDLDLTPADLDFRDRAIPDFGNHLERDAWTTQVASWRHYGVEEVWLDFASTAERRQAALLFGDWLYERFGMRVSGEALPRTWPDSNGKLDRALTGRMGWMALSTYFRQHDPEQAWTAEDGETLFVGLRPGDQPTHAEMTRWRDRGFIPFIYSASMLDAVAGVWRVGIAP